MAYDLEKSVGFKINQTANKLNNEFNYILQVYDIAPEQRATLEIIKYEKDVNQTKISNILGKDKTTISRTLATLEKKNLISKTQINKRTNLIQLTLEGEKILEDSNKLVKEFRENLISNLSEEEVIQLISLLGKITKSVEEEL
ncbi:MAG: MarR family transcriptional regulator [Erysipelotrichia bacterium]|nr:MarR family transcriptional regulator [Erysipelotrichia bacterium]